MLRHHNVSEQLEDEVRHELSMVRALLCPAMRLGATALHLAAATRSAARSPCLQQLRKQVGSFCPLCQHQRAPS